MYAGAGDDTVYGGAGFDKFYASEGADHYDGGKNRDDVRYFNSTEGLVIDMNDASQSTGLAAGDTFHLIEEVLGTNYDDVIRVSEGVRVRDARNGNDDITDSTGLEVLRGGNGADIFRFVANDGETDQISDFTIGEDRIDVAAWGVSSFNDLVFTSTNDGADTLVSFGSESVLLKSFDEIEIGLVGHADFIL